MKKYLMGVLTGVLVSIGTVGVFATAQTYTLSKYEVPVYIGGTKYTSEDLPVLSLKLNGGDNTYVPLRNFSDMAGLEVEYDKTAKVINITGGVGEKSVANSASFSNKYKVTIYEIDGTEYVSYSEIDEAYFDDDYKEYNDEFEFRKTTTGGFVNLKFDGDLVLENIPVMLFDGKREFITLDYFVSDILPLIKL